MSGDQADLELAHSEPNNITESSQVVRLEDLGELIRSKRWAEGLTLEQVAQQSGVSAARR